MYVAAYLQVSSSIPGVLVIVRGNDYSDTYVGKCACMYIKLLASRQTEENNISNAGRTKTSGQIFEHFNALPKIASLPFFVASYFSSLFVSIGFTGFYIF
jgi:hypothetical protein